MSKGPLSNNLGWKGPRDVTWPNPPPKPGKKGWRKKARR